MQDREHTNPAGAVAVLINPDGRVVVSASDFDRTSYGGFKVSEAQEHRVRGALANAAIRFLTMPDVADVMRGYDAEQVMDRLVKTKGYRISVFNVGGDEAS